MRRFRTLVVFAATLCASTFVATAASPANRLTYLDGSDPYYPNVNFPRLITPQWVGETGVEAVVIMAIDDMRESKRYETFLRPVLERLKKIDGRAPLSIMTCLYTSNDLPQLQSWLKEGVSIEVHTLQHPCPLLQRGDLGAAQSNVFDCLDLLAKIPGNMPVAFRMPCCDSMNSPSPRFYAEIFNDTSAGNSFLHIDSSVMNVTTTNDLALRDFWPAHRSRSGAPWDFHKYFPTETNAVTKLSLKNFSTWIEDYPYPYVIDKVCWEFPCAVPSDWESFNLQGATNPVMLADWKAGLDATVIKQGVFTMVFHPYGWSSPEQLVELIDYADKKYGKRVKFLNFKEALERLNKNLLKGHPLRDTDGDYASSRLIDLDGDGYLDVLVGRTEKVVTRLWRPKNGSWTEFPNGPPDIWPVADSQSGILASNGFATRFLYVWVTDSPLRVVWDFTRDGWKENREMSQPFGARTDVSNEPAFPNRLGYKNDVRFRDIDNCGRTELIVSNPKQNAIFKWAEDEKSWKKLPYALPQIAGVEQASRPSNDASRVVVSNATFSVSIADVHGHDNGLRFVDLNGDGFDDIVFSNEKYFGIWLWVPTENKRLGWNVGWTDEIISGKRGDPGEIPMISRGGEHPNNGVWFKDGFMWVQNEDTATLPDKVRRISFHDLLTSAQPKSKSPKESLDSIRVRPGFKVELVASEPLIESPIAFDWSADGRLWVVEMPDYPLGLDGKGKAGGRVRILEDTDGDGIYDKTTIFLDDLNFPTGIIPWRNGVIIAAAPDIFFAEEREGKCVSRKTLFTGFREGNQQHRLNGFDYGLDGWVYGANGDSGGIVRYVGAEGRGTVSNLSQSRLTSAAASSDGVDLRGHDFRFRPDTGEFEAIEGQTQYGRHRDDWGNWFGNNNPNWVWHYFLPERYLKRNPFLSVKTTRKILASYPESTRCFPISRMLQRFNDFFAYNHVTSGNSATPYRDDLFGPEFVSSVFISEPVHNLVHREVLEPDGVSFNSHRAEGEATSEFLASSDNWFRPTMMRTGPDGALYVADMYRLVIEHPEWIPPHIQKQYDLRAGSDKGRIYRVYPEGKKPRKIPNLQKLDATGLVAAMESPNGWQRDTAQRLLTERRDKAAIEPLKKLAATSANPKTRLQSLCVLAALNGLTSGALATALKDGNADVRSRAIELAESAVPKREIISLPAFLERANDPSPKVRYQFALSLGEMEGGGSVLAGMLDRNSGDADLRTALLSSARPHARELLLRLLNTRANDPSFAETIAVMRRLATNNFLGTATFRVVNDATAMSPARRAARQKVVEQYGAVNGLKGDARHGAELFKQSCATCHRFKNEGAQVGPDLGIMTGKPVAEILLAILDPNAAVDPVFINYVVALKDGRELNGVIVSETANGLTIRNAGGLEETLLRSDIKELRNTGSSLMPEGLESALSLQDMADVMAHLQSN